MSVEVHWHEGLFLQQHHLQMLQGLVQSRAAGERRLGWAYPYGLVEAKLSGDDLENFRVRFDRLRAVMPSGTVVDFPEGAELPSLEIRGALGASSAGVTVRLGVPVRYPTRANTIDNGEALDPTVKRHWIVRELQRADENTGDGEQPVLVRKVNARLLADGDDASDLETIPLLRVVRGTGDDIGVPRLDASFVPPCMTLSGSPALRGRLRDLAAQLEASRGDLASRLGKGYSAETIRGGQIEQLLRLRTLARHAATLPALVAAGGGVSPFDVYLELCELLAELSALHPDQGRFDAPAYNHDGPGPVFAQLEERIRALLKPAGQATWLQVAFRRDGELLVAELTEEHLSRANEFYLGIRTQADPAEVARAVENADEFKLMPKSMAHTRVRGVRLVEDRHPPLQLPSQAGLCYFRLDRTGMSQMVWERIAQERTAALRSPAIDRLGLDNAALYMTTPN